MDRLTSLARTVWKQSQENDVSGMAAELSYRLFVASVPVFAFLATVGAIAAGVLGGENPAREVVDSTGDALPSDIATTLERELERLIDSSGPVALVTTLAGSLWTGSLAMGSVVKSLERIHNARVERSRWQRWTLVVGLTVVGGILLILALLGLLLSELYQDDLAGWVGLGTPSAALVTVMAWALAFVLVVASAGILYHAVPPFSTRARWVTYGGAGFGLTWLIGSIAWLIYLSNFDTYGGTYGLLGAILLALGWLYFSSTAFLLGAQLDLSLCESH